MPKRTEGVRLLVQDVLWGLTEPYGEDVIEDVFVEIGGNPEFQRRYDELIEKLTLPVVNSWIGWHTKDITGLNTLREVDAKRTRLIKSYTKLVP